MSGDSKLHDNGLLLDRGRSRQPTLFQSRKWHIYNNNGSYKGWFDWIPQWMRVGYWSPATTLFLVLFYSSLFWYKPQPLVFPVETSPILSENLNANLWRNADAIVFIWGIFVFLYGSRNFEGMCGICLSYTGWSWNILTARAGLEFVAPFLGDGKFGRTVAVMGSALRFPAFLAAVITFFLWNFVLMPLIYFASMKSNETEKRAGFLRFCFSFFMINVHILNLPLAMVNIVYGAYPRLFTTSDLWIAYFILMMYMLLYVFVMDRLGLHLYPFICLRSAWCIVSCGLLLFLYYSIMHSGNSFLWYLHPNL